jgi:hypothetical protein
MGKRALALVGCLVVVVCTGGCLGLGGTDAFGENTPTEKTTPSPDDMPAVTPTETPPEKQTPTQTPTETPDSGDELLPSDVRERGYANFTDALEETLNDSTVERRVPPSINRSVASLEETTRIKDTLELSLRHANATHPLYTIGTTLDALAGTIDGSSTALDRDFVDPEDAGKFPLIPPKIRLTFDTPNAAQTTTVTVDSERLAQYAAGELSREAVAEAVIAPAIEASETVSPYADQHPERYLPGGYDHPKLESNLLADSRTEGTVRLDSIEDTDGNRGVEVFVRDRTISTDAVASKRAGELLHELARNINNTGVENLSADAAGEDSLDFVAVTARSLTTTTWTTVHASTAMLDSYYKNQTSRAELAKAATTLGDGPTPARYRADHEQVLTGLKRATYRDYAAQYGEDLEAREETMFGGEVDLETKLMQGQAEYGDAQIMVEPKEPGLSNIFAEQMILTVNQTAPHLRPERGLLLYLDNPTPQHYDREAGDALLFLNTSGAVELTAPGATINPWNFRYDLDSPEGYLPPGDKREHDPFFEGRGPLYWEDAQVGITVEDWQANRTGET